MVDFSLSEQQLAIQKTARDFAEKEIKPLAAQIDRIADPAKAWNWDIYTKANRLGYNKILIPQKYGGLGLAALDAALVIEELSAADAGVGSSYFVQIANTRMIDDGATDEQKKEFFIACCNDPDEKYLIALAETEHGVPYDLGADPAVARAMDPQKVALEDFYTQTEVPMLAQKEMITTAKRDGDDWVINGMKRFITMGSQAKLYLVHAKTEPDYPDAMGVATFFVPAGTPGLSFGRIEDKMGHRLTVNAEVCFDDCRVPDKWKWDYRTGMGKRGLTLSAFCSAVSVGIARRAFEEAIAYAQTRYKFGSRIVFKQAVQRMLVDMAINVKASRLLTWQSCYNDDHEIPASISPMAKVFTSEAALENAKLGMQVFGGYGYMRDLPMEKLYRDARLMSIYDGSNEMLRHLILAPAITIDGTA